MKLLLDTHAFIWWDSDQNKMSKRALVACQDPVNTLHLSVVSVWELQIKMQLGKLILRRPLATTLEDQQRNGLYIEGIGVEGVLSLSLLPLVHRDPFDRLLIAQAKRGEFCLVSHDSQITTYDLVTLW